LSAASTAHLAALRSDSLLAQRVGTSILRAQNFVQNAALSSLTVEDQPLALHGPSAGSWR